MGQRQIEMTWVCSACSHKNLGRYQRCQHCNVDHILVEVPLEDLPNFGAATKHELRIKGDRVLVDGKRVAH